ncbi:D-alanyl-D-alanine carboxypeptidase, partial [Streptacidiphilus monticola]
MGSGERVARWGRAYAQAPTRWVAGVAGAVGLALAAGSIAAAGPWDGGQRHAERLRARADAHRIAAAQGGKSKPLPEQPSWRQPAPVLVAATGGAAPTA